MNSDTLRENEEKLQAALTAVQGIIWTNNANGEMEGEQEAWAALTGQCYADYQGYGWAQVIHPDDVVATIAAWELAVLQQSPFNIEHRVKIKDGSWRIFNAKAIPLKDGDGTLREWVGVHTDITEQRRAENAVKESEEKFRTMADSSDILIGVNNETINAVYFNKAWEQLTGRPVTDLLNLGWADLLHPDDKEPFLQKFRDAHHNKVSYEGEFRMLNKEGDYSWLFAKVQVRHHPDGSYAGHISSCIDITDRKKNETALKESEARLQEQQRLYETVTANTPDLIYVLSPNYRFTYANNAMLTMWGKTRQQSIGKTLLENGYDPWHAGMHAKEIDQVIATKKAIRGEVAFPHAVLGERIYDYIFSPVMSKEGDVIAISGTSRDISDIKNAEEELKESENRFRNMIGQAPVAILLSRGEDMIIETVNQPMLPFIHKNAATEVVGKKMVEALPELEGQPILETVRSVLRTGISFRGDEQAVDLVYNGRLERRYFNLSYDQIKDGTSIAAVLHMAIDVTEQVMARKQIEESEARYRTLFESMDQGFCIIEMQFDATGEPVDYLFIEINPVFEKQTGLKNAVGKTALQLVPNLEKIWLERYGSVARSGKSIRFTEGSVEMGRMFDVSAFRVGDNDSRRVALLFSDITEQRNSENKIRESEKQFRLLADTMPQQVWTADVAGNLNYYNQSVFDYSGLSPEQINQEGWLQIVHPDDREENIIQWMQSIQQGTDFLFEHRFRRYDGEYRWQLSRAVPQKDSNGNIILWVGSSTDIHAIREDEQRKSEFIKLVSHELKTPVTSMKGYVQFLLSLLKKEVTCNGLLATVQASLVRVDLQIIRLTRLITEMLDLSRIESGRLEWQQQNFSLNELVKATAQDILHTSSSHEINIREDDLLEVSGDRDRLEQVIINFINNAIKYSPDSNIIHIRIYKTTGNEAAVCVQDFGIGINKDEQAKIFERFYRVEGRREETFSGFGIGLYIANEIIQRHAGRITVESTINQGASFTFILPLVY